MRIPRFRFFALSAVAAAVVACGGGSSVIVPAPVTLSGEVIDGYIEGATVCFDANGDGVCGSGEPSAVTTADGKFSLSVTGSTSGKFILVDVPSSAKDSDDGGLTLAAAGKSAYAMATPASEPSVVSPLTTLVVGKIKTDGVTLAEARSRVLDELGLAATTNLHADHVEAGDTQVHAAARQVAARLQQVKSSLGSGGSTDVVTSVSNKIRDQDEGLGTLLSSDPADLVNVPTNLGSVANGKLLLYKMISAKGAPIYASAMLFTPKTSAPPGGRPLVVLGVGTTGIARQCGPSVQMQAGGGFDYELLVAGMLQNGFAVVVPDYEGRGPAGVVPNAHPYLHVGSAGNSMVLAAVAAKRFLGNELSGAWAAWGHSQGGHAALAAAQYASLGERLLPALDYRGAVAVAPASHFVESVQGLIGLANAASSNNEAFSLLGSLGFTRHI